MSDLQRVFWRHGLFLQPQHFQSLDTRIDALSYQLSALHSADLWGVISLTLNVAALMSNQCEAQQARLLFPSGTYVQYPGNAIIQSRHLVFDETNTGEQKLYLILRRERPHGSNVDTGMPESLSMGEQAARFISTIDPEEVVDRYEAGDQGEVHYLSYRLQFALEAELSNYADCEHLHVATIERFGESWSYKQNALVPSVQVSASHGLNVEIKLLRDEVLSRVQQLASVKAALFEGAVASEWLQMLAILHRLGMSLQFMTESPDEHPKRLHQLLRMAISELSLFSPKYNLFGEYDAQQDKLPAYQHHQPEGCFRPVIARLKALLDDIIGGPEYILRFAPVEQTEGLFEVELGLEHLAERQRYYLVLTAQHSDAGIEQSLLRAKLAPKTLLPHLIDHALPSIALMALQDIPKGLPRRQYAHYLYVDTQSDLWVSLHKKGALALFLPGLKDRVEIELMVTKW